MKKVSVCLVDDDDWFRDMFSQYMVHTCRNISMTSEDFRSWKDGNCGEKRTDRRDFDLYIFGGAEREFILNERTAAISEQSIFLYRNETEFRNVRENLPSAELISKYVSASNIAAHINFTLSERQMSTGFTADRTSFFVISITSSCGGAGKTSVSLALSRLLQQKRKRNVLLVSTSLLYDAGRYFESSEEGYRTLNEYLYHLFAGDEPEASLSLYTIKDRFGVASFCLSDGISELAGLNRHEMECFIDSLDHSQLFDTLIFDLDNSNNEVTGLIAERSDVMLILSSGDDAVKMAGYWSSHILDHCAAEPGNIWMVINKEGQDENQLKFCIESGLQESCNNAMMKFFSIPYDPYSFYSSDGVRQISMTGSFAAAIDGIIKEVISFA